MMNNKIIALVLGLIFSTQVFAQSVWFGGTIKRIYPTSSGAVVVIFNEDSPSCTNGSNPKYHYLTVGENNVTQEGFNAMYAALLTAASAKKKVSINFDSSANACYINRLQVHFE